MYLLHHCKHRIYLKLLLCSVSLTVLQIFSKHTRILVMQSLCTPRDVWAFTRTEERRAETQAGGISLKRKHKANKAAIDVIKIKYTPVISWFVDTVKPRFKLYAWRLGSKLTARGLNSWQCSSLCGGHMFGPCSCGFPPTVQTHTGHMNRRLCISNLFTGCYGFMVFFQHRQLREWMDALTRSWLQENGLECFSSQI